MAKGAKLKVYCTPIGFHDAYVAAPSQKAALEAWGSDRNLFARGVAQVVTDPELTAGPLAEPGTVIRRLRGSAAEQFAALPPDAPKAARPRKGAAGASPSTDTAARKQSRPRPAPPPRPDRSALDEAERRLEAAEAQHR